MNQVSQMLSGIINRYLGHDAKKVFDFTHNYVSASPLGDSRHICLLTGRELREGVRAELHPSTSGKQIIEASNKALKKLHFTDRQIKNHNRKRRQVYKEVRDHILLHADQDDLIACDFYHHDFGIIRPSDRSWVVDQFLTYLFEQTPLTWRVKWMLDHKEESDRKFGEEIDMAGSLVSRYRKGTTGIGNMTLTHADKINRYYHHFIMERLMPYTAVKQSSKAPVLS